MIGYLFVNFFSGPKTKSNSVEIFVEATENFYFSVAQKARHNARRNELLQHSCITRKVFAILKKQIERNCSIHPPTPGYSSHLHSAAAQVSYKFKMLL